MIKLTGKAQYELITNRYGYKVGQLFNKSFTLICPRDEEILTKSAIDSVEIRESNAETYVWKNLPTEECFDEETGEQFAKLVQVKIHDITIN